jgi:hypothetical protein
VRGGNLIGALTKLIGPAEIGKIQFQVKFSPLAVFPGSREGLDGHLALIGTESKSLNSYMGDWDGRKQLCLVKRG